MGLKFVNPTESYLRMKNNLCKVTSLDSQKHCIHYEMEEDPLIFFQKPYLPTTKACILVIKTKERNLINSVSSEEIA
jgi:hypothetical protein